MARSIMTQESGYAPAVIAGIYGVVATIYIIVSSWTVASWTATPAVVIEIAKGIGFVLITTGALWWLLLRQRRKNDYLVHTLEQILDNLGDGVFVVRLPERVIDYANPAAEKIFGFEAASLVGQSTAKLHVDREHHHEFDRIGAEALARDHVFVGNFEMRRQNGEIFPTSHVVTTFRDEQGLDFSVSVVRDESLGRVGQR